VDRWQRSRGLDQRAINIGEILVGCLIGNDPEGLAVALVELSVKEDERLRHDLRLVGLLLSFSRLNTRRLWRRLPNTRERELILSAIEAGPFAATIDLQTARHIIWLVCGENRGVVAFSTDLRHVLTCLTVGAALLDRQGKGLSFTWASRYRALLSTMSRHPRIDPAPIPGG
jgi:hypothetical protein